MPHTESGQPAILVQFLAAAGEYLGISDKRLLVQEPEFARVLKSMERDSNSAARLVRLCDADCG